MTDLERAREDGQAAVLRFVAEPAVPADAGIQAAALPAKSDQDKDLILPTPSQWQVVLARCEDTPSLVKLQEVAATLHDAAKHHHLVRENLVEVAEWHLRIKRKLGAVLSQTVVRGGYRPKSHAATLPPGGLPENISKSESWRMQRLAAVPDLLFEEYVAKSRKRLHPPSSAGALAHAAKAKMPGRQVKRARVRLRSAEKVEVTAEIVDAAERLFGDIDVCPPSRNGNASSPVKDRRKPWPSSSWPQARKGRPR